MNLLHFIFNAINPDRKVTWLSQRYHRWESSRMKRRNDNYRKNNDVPSIYFEVPGAGDICMSESCHHSTGQVVGFSFGVEWGRYGFCGGVIGRDEAKRMAEFILQKCSETTETMQEEKERMKRERNEYFKALAKKNKRKRLEAQNFYRAWKSGINYIPCCKIVLMFYNSYIENNHHNYLTMNKKSESTLKVMKNYMRVQNYSY